MTDEADQADVNRAIERREQILESPHANQLEVHIESKPFVDVDGIQRRVCTPVEIDKEFHKKWLIARESAFIDLEGMR